MTLFGQGNGDLAVSFEWTTTVDGPFPEPEAQIGVLADHDGSVDSFGVELSVTNLASTPTNAQATITVTAADGNSLTFDPLPRTLGPDCTSIEGSVAWNGPLEHGVAAAALGPPPFTYDVTVTLDGVAHRAIATWPDEQIAGSEPYVGLDFDPPLPALGDR